MNAQSFSCLLAKPTATAFVLLVSMTAGIVGMAEANGAPAASKVSEHRTSDAGHVKTVTIRGRTVPAGSRLLGNWIVSPDGTRLSLTAKNAATCPAERLCLFEHIDFGGLVVIFTDRTKVNLDDYGFNETMTSFINNLPVDASWFEWRHGTWGNPSHCMKAHSSARYVEPNDTASAIETWSSNNSC